MPSNIFLWIFLQSKSHTVFITACSAGLKAPSFLWDRGRGGRRLFSVAENSKAMRHRVLTARKQPNKRPLLSFLLTAHSMKLHPHTAIRTNTLLLHPTLQAAKRSPLLGRELPHLKATAESRAGRSEGGQEFTMDKKKGVNFLEVK